MMVLKTIATFGLRVANAGISSKIVSLNIAQGSVLEFSAPASSSTSSVERIGAIVNAANQECLNGGGVDGAINAAGGPELWKDRRALPILKGTPGLRCLTGDAVVTGPSIYGDLTVPYVIHAVGPNYMHFDDFSEPDALLRSAYQESLNRCKEKGITDVGFSLLSAGIYRGQRKLEDVLNVSVMAIRDWVVEMAEKDRTCAANSTSEGEQHPSAHQLHTITLCGFSQKEVETLMKVCKTIFNEEEIE